MGTGDDRDFAHLIALRKGTLHLGSRKAVAGNVHHIIDPTGDADVFHLVHPCTIARVITLRTVIAEVLDLEPLHITVDSTCQRRWKWAKN